MITTVWAGRRAENLASIWLQDQGFEILMKNWRTRYCEIDIIAYRNQRIHFVEVKYRRRSNSGSGFEYITPNKRRRMNVAARLWTHKHGRRGCEVQLDVISVSGFPEPKNVEYLPNITADF